MAVKLTSSITFLYFDDLSAAKKFFTDVLGLKTVYDPGWAAVYALGPKSFIGAVDAASGSIDVPCRGGVLISLTVKNIEEVHDKFAKLGLKDLSPIEAIEDIHLRSFFFTGPEGYKFEVQQFTKDRLSELF